MTDRNGREFQPLSWSPALDPPTPTQDNFLMEMLSPFISICLGKMGIKKKGGWGVSERDKSDLIREEESE